ncbi:MAG: hypothetical protein Q4D41_01315 [Prevotellaceae bacterium]|nr:hypothetical protein [Prevotellaceae bacterium]
MKKILFSTIFLLCMTTLSFAQNRSVLMHLKSGEIKEFNVADIDSLTFSDPVNYDLDIVATSTLSLYYGSGEYYVTISDAPMDSDGLPTQVGQTIVRFYAIGEKSIDSNNAILPSGRYVSGSSLEEGSIYDGEGYMVVLRCTGIDAEGNIDGYQIDLETCVANVEYKSNGTYDIEFKGSLSEIEGVDFTNIRMTYSGPIAFENNDPSAYKTLAEDVNMVPTAMSGRYTNMAGAYGNYSIAFYNCPLDEDGFIIGAGELMSVELLTSESASMDISKIAGTYTISSALEGPWAPYNFLDGSLYEYYGMYIPLGTYYTVYGEGGSSTNLYGFAKDGTVVVTVDGTNITFDFDLIVEGGKSLTMDFTGDASTIQDYTVYGAPKAVNSKNGFTKVGKGRANIHNSGNVLRLVKKF